MTEMQNRLQEEMVKMSEPSAIQKREKREKEFGWESLVLAIGNDHVSGRLPCSQAVGSNLEVKGIVKLTGK